jgi:outer membrane immunogenic protein
MKLHKVVLSTVAALALAATTTSTSAGGRGSLKDDRPFSWSGFSIGVHAGYGFEGSGDQTTLTDGLGFIDPRFGGVSTEGVFAGVSLGKDWQVRNVVYGIVVDISKSDFSGFFTPGQGDGFETKIDWFGTVRGKLGYANGPYLLYATAGLAYGKLKATQGDIDVNGPIFDPVTGFVSKSETRIGWAAGGGIDVAVAKNLIFGFEYLYVNLGDETVTMTGPQDGGTITSRVNVDADIHTVRANLRYKF